MQLKLTAAAVLFALAVPAAAQSQTAVTNVRVEGAWKTLVPEARTVVDGQPVVKDGDPSHACAGGTAAGALEAATQGDWGGQWSDGLGYFVQRILGETHAGSPDFWTLWLNGRPSSTGLCDTPVKTGDEILLFVDRCVFDPAAQACSGEPITPLVLSLPRSVRRNKAFTVVVRELRATGSPQPVAGASVKAIGGRKARTDRRGRARLTLARTGRNLLRAYARGHIRSAHEAVEVRS